jgi:Protein of unknown function (DUF4058)
MSNIFPGMDPFLEDPALWPDFHSTFLNYWREALADVLPAEYEASLGERVYLVEQDPDTRKLIYPDVALSQSNPEAAPSRSPDAVATIEPVTIPLTIVGGARATYIEILHRPDRTLVAVLEMLSPANKQHPGRIEYLAKRNALLQQDVHLVELDLLVGGRRLPFEKPLPAGDYCYFLSRSDQRPDCQVYAWNLPHALPSLPVPLRAPSNDIVIDYDAVFATAFGRGRFGRSISYALPCPAPLTEASRSWVEEMVRQPRNGSNAD